MSLLEIILGDKEKQKVTKTDTQKRAEELIRGVDENSKIMAKKTIHAQHQYTKARTKARTVSQRSEKTVTILDALVIATGGRERIKKNEQQ